MVIRKLLKRFGYIHESDAMPTDAAIALAKEAYRRGHLAGIESGFDQGISAQAVYLDPYAVQQALEEYIARREGKLALH